MDSTDTSNEPTPTPGDAIAPSWWGQYRNLVVPVVALVALVLYFGSKNSAFLSTASAQNILRQLAFLTVLAIAGTLVILIGGIDLSVAANATLAGILVAKWVDPLGLGAVLLAMAACGLVGLVNGLITVYLRVPSFLVTLGMLSVLNGLSNTIADGRPVSFGSATLATLINREYLFGIPNGTVIALILVGALTFAAYVTPFGRQMYAVGGNERAARLVGVPVVRVRLTVFTLAGAVAGLAGVVLTGQAGVGVPLGADPSLLNSIAAVVVGGTALSGGVGGPHRSLLGALVIVILGSGMDITSVAPYTQLMVKGVVVVAAVALTIDRRRYGMIK